MDNKYKNGKIYTIRNRNDDTLIYIGSTVVPLYKRFSNHKKDSKGIRCVNMPLYVKMNETDINDWYIELFEDFPCERKEQLNKREGEIIRQIGTLNKRIEGRTHKEFYEDNKEKILEKAKEYYEANKDIIIKKNKEFYEDNKEKILEKAKEYYEANKDNFLEREQKYRDNNKDKIYEYAKQYREANKENAKENAKKYYLKKKLEKEEANISIS